VAHQVGDGDILLPLLTELGPVLADPDSVDLS